MADGALLLQDQDERFCSLFGKSRFLDQRGRRQIHAADASRSSSCLGFSLVPGNEWRQTSQSDQPFTYPQRDAAEDFSARAVCPFLSIFCRFVLFDGPWLRPTEKRHRLGRGVAN